MRRDGFTMVEIAIALGVIAFALVAIIGILPTGLNVQRNNRSETIINQDAGFWLDAIKNGARGLDDLVKQVDRIDVHYNYNVPNVNPTVETYRNFRSGWEIIGLLTIPARTNAEVYASVWSISGSAAEKEPNFNDRAVAFKYRLHVNMDRQPNNAVGFFDQTLPRPANMDPALLFSPLISFYDLRLSLAYPLIHENPTINLKDLSPAPTRRQTVRTGVSRRFVIEPSGGVDYTFFVP
jgi:type II secretory pathway pseudopilin PulG